MTKKPKTEPYTLRTMPDTKATIMELSKELGIDGNECGDMIVEKLKGMQEKRSYSQDKREAEELTHALLCIVDRIEKRKETTEISMKNQFEHEMYERNAEIKRLTDLFTRSSQDVNNLQTAFNLLEQKNDALEASNEALSQQIILLQKQQEEQDKNIQFVQLQRENERLTNKLFQYENGKQSH